MLVFVAEQLGLNLAISETEKTDFCMILFIICRFSDIVHTVTFRH